MTQEHFELLARIDERTISIEKKLTDHVETVKNHISDDRTEFGEIKSRLLWLSMAILALSFIVGGPEIITRLIK